jgi:uncharacterized protein YfaS (alpha-2-macroglobulin family)
VSDFTVSKDVVVRTEMPSFLIAGDQSQITEVVNVTKKNMSANLSLTAPGLSLDTDAHQKVDASTDAPGSYIWQVHTTSPTKSPVTATAQGDSGSDGIETPLVVEPHVTTSTVWTSGQVIAQTGSAAPTNISFNLPGNISQTQVRLHLIPTPDAALLSVSKYLAAYPYGSSDEISSTLG